MRLATFGAPLALQHSIQRGPSILTRLRVGETRSARGRPAPSVVVALALMIASVLPGHAQNAGAQAQLGPDAVAPYDAAMDCLREFEQSNFRACLVGAGVSRTAIDAAMWLSSADSPAILTDYMPIGPVDIAEITIPQAGSGTTYALSLRGEEVVSIDDLLNPMDVRDTASASLQRAYPEATTMSFGRVAGHRYMGEAGQRFVLTWLLTDGCRACEVVGEAIGYVDFQDGLMIDSGMIGWSRQRGEFPTETAEIQRRLQARDALELQTQLNLRGYIAGSMDGVYGDNSGSALQQFLIDHCLDGSSFSSEAAGLLSVASRFETLLVDAPCGAGDETDPETLPRAEAESVAGLTIENSGPDVFNIFGFLMSDFCVGRHDCYYFTQREVRTCESECLIEGVEGRYVGRKIEAGRARELFDRSGRQMEILTQQGVPRGLEGRTDSDDIAGSSAYRVFRAGCEAERCDSMLVHILDETTGFVVDVRADARVEANPAKDLMSALSSFRARVHAYESFGEFVSNLNTLREAALSINDIREAMELFESSLTPRIAAQAEASRATQGGLLFVGAHITTYIVKDMYARAADDPANAPRIVGIVPERVALATIDAAFNISAAVVTDPASALVGQTITTTTNIVDAVIAYLALGQETDQLVNQALQQTASAIQSYRDGDLPEEVALAQFEVTQAISDEMTAGWFTWGPSVDAADRLAIIAGLARMKILEGEPPLPPISVLGTGVLRNRIAKMNGEHCFSCTPEFNQRYLVFADRVARDFMVRGWDPMATPALLEGADADEEVSGDTIEADLSRIEAYFTAAMGVDSEHVQLWLQEANLLSGSFAPYGSAGQHATWALNVESAFRAALVYARAENIPYDLSDENGFYRFVSDVRDHRLTPVDGATITLDEALERAVEILLGDPYGQTREDVLGHIADARIEQDDPCGAEIAWAFDVHVPDAPNMGGQSIRGDLLVDARTGRMVCAELPFLN